MEGLSWIPGEETHNHERPRPSQRGKQPAAHYEADPMTLDYLLWSNDTENTFSQGKLSLRDNKVYIADNGLYYVYTQATFRGSSCSQRSSVLLSHDVVLFSSHYGLEVNLLSAQKTPCGELGQHTSNWSRSIFQGGIFELQKGNLLYTRTQGEDYLSRDSGQTYLGVYAL
ncbi:lymphotoxin-alpha-like [Pelodytes ibericus]